MPYSIYLAPDLPSAQASLPDLSLDYQVHQRIFNPDEADLHDLTLFYNLSDYYQDAAFVESHVLGLRTELEEARRRIHDPKATEALSLLTKLVDRAAKERLNVYAFGE